MIELNFSRFLIPSMLCELTEFYSVRHWWDLGLFGALLHYVYDCEITFLWLLSTDGVTKAFSHRSHLYFLWPSCTTWMCTLSVSLRLKVASHWSHLNVLSPGQRRAEDSSQWHSKHHFITSRPDAPWDAKLQNNVDSHCSTFESVSTQS